MTEDAVYKVPAEIRGKNSNRQALRLTGDRPEFSLIFFPSRTFPYL
jgi:hypothetical protein